MQESDALAFEILRAIRRIVRRVSDHSRRLSRDAGLTVPQLLCLRAIAELGAAGAEVTGAGVAAKIQLGPPTVSRILDRLEQAGLVVRERRSADRRRVCLSLTAAGRTRMESLPPPLQDRFLSRVLALDAEARRTLLASLEQIVAMMEASEIDAAPLLASDDVHADDGDPAP